ncbi:MAG: hypothetical protein U5K54_01985 [Cytophagales bacterium]|nr:hypothetical protein [Cytophagales bacterium]
MSRNLKLWSFFENQIKGRPDCWEWSIWSCTISYLFRVLRQSGMFTNALGCFNKAGELLWQDEIGTNLKGIGINTFFIAYDYLFFVKNKTELVTFRIV